MKNMSLNDGSPTMTMPVAPTGMTGGGWGGFGGDNGWWIIILFLAIFCGWGGNGNGFGNNGRNSGGVVDGYVLASDFSNIERKIDSVNQGLCDGFYQQAQLVNGTNMAMANGFAQAELSRCNQQAALMQQLNNMAMQAQECCCENRAAIAQVRYDMATQACDTRNTVQNTTRDIIDAMNCGFRSIDQRLTAQELAAKDAKIAEQNQQLFGYQLAASQAAQNNYLVSTLRPSPSPAYVVANPYCCNSGYNYGCGNCA
jgi:hypothetical protein|nr:MAG TPA: hypothetical protein [Caudoviricetes sp.]DAY04723.1 MAG TPA: hypothetical protein [Caudoviricetes sp.]DAZ64788.1 MAG TPA: hypothetical protein [Caudoviricetes sp.]